MRIARLFILTALAVLVIACQTAKPSPQPAPPPEAPSAPAPSPQAIAPGQSIIQTEVSGFSPTAENGKNSIQFALKFANSDAVKTWKVAIAGKAGVVRSFSGTGPSLPANLSWDGKTDAGAAAAEGSYAASLSIDYGDAFKPSSASSKDFILDGSPPSGKLTVSPGLFSPNEPKAKVTISIEASSTLAKIDSWSMDILDPEGNLFKSFDGKWPDAKVVWDGTGIGGGTVESAEDYPVVVKLRDEFGNVGTLKAGVSVDIVVIKEAKGYRIPNSRIFFKDFTADYHDVPAELQAQNSARLDHLAATLKKFPGYKIRIVGHAVMIHWDSPSLGKIEEETVLLPLSQARADAIKQAMVDRGLDASLISTEGVGASDQLVPDSDYQNRWRNRRTAIYLEK
ncbi:MAG TPA: OmpA family protein [Rectinemataceae bacterium]|nr:OmpA family protein [Rectinemataceae bacterium]